MAAVFYPSAEPYAADLIGPGLFASVAAGLAIFLVSLIVLIVGAHLISKVVRGSALGSIDRSLGFLFGLFCGYLVLSALWLGYAWVIPAFDRPAWIREAQSLPVIQAGADALATVLPADYQRRLEADGATTPDQAFEPPMQPGTDGQGGDGQGGDGEAPPAGYDERERQELERLIEQQQQQ
jgi:membrane protein required for colicin V production